MVKIQQQQTLKKKQMKIGIGAILALVTGYIIASPYITAFQVKAAAENLDGEALSEYIDFSALRQSLKEQMNAAVGQAMVKEFKEDNPFAILGATFGSMILEEVIEFYVTPAAIMELMKSEKKLVLTELMVIQQGTQRQSRFSNRPRRTNPSVNFP